MEKNTQLANTWTPFATMFLGAWLLVSPGTFGYLGSALGTSDIICGILLIIFGWGMRRCPSSLIYSIPTLIGVWLQFAPLALTIPQAVGYLNNTLVGVLVILFSAILARHDEPKTSAIPKGWSYNPSAYAQRFPVIFLTACCWFLARYLSAYQLGFIDTMWEPFFGMGTIDVITSDISKEFPVSDAGLGAFAYTLEFLLGCHGNRNRWQRTPWLVLSFGLLVVPVGLVSILLIILQPLAVHAWCSVCLLTAIGMLIMIVFTLDEVAASLQLLKRGRRSGMPFWDLLWYGLREDHEMDDPRDLPMSAPSSKLFKVFFLGCGMPLNLLVSALLGVVCMMMPAYMGFDGIMADIDHVAGAFIVVFSVLSMAEIARKSRFILWLLAIALIVSNLVLDSGISILLHLILGVLVILFAYRQGKIKEKYGYG